MINEVVTNEVIDKFHRALCPKCTGKCMSHHYPCSYDYTHTRTPEPDINIHWKNYVEAIVKKGSEWNMTVEEIYALLTTDGPISAYDAERVYELQMLFRKI